MAEKDSTLVLKVDLGCPRCCKKIKKILCKFEEIREKKYDEKKNTVTITGPFCPHKLKKKLRCKAGCIIICIEILPPPKIDKKTQTDETPKIDKNTQTDETPKIEKKTQTDEPEPPPIRVCCKHCFEGHRVGPCHLPQCCQGLKRPPPPPPPPPPCYCNYGRPPCYCGCRGTMGYASTCKFYVEEDPALKMFDKHGK